MLIAASPTLSSTLPNGSVGDPDIFQTGGSTVVFSGSTSAFAPLGEALACGLSCTGTFALTDGALSALSPAPAAASNTATFETQPRLTANGAVVFNYWQYQSVSSSSLGAPTSTGIYQRPIPTAAGQPLGSAWPGTASETLAANADPAPDPVDATMLAWVENQDPACTTYTLRGAAACQFAIQVGSSSSPSAPVSIYDDELAAAGTGPSSLAWSSDGKELLVVDDHAPNSGIYEFAASTNTAPGAKAITEVVAQPPGWTFSQARFAGKLIVFDAAGRGASTPDTSDIYSVAANCDAGSCQFPSTATNLTNNAGADNIDPAWTSTRAPLVAEGSPLQAGAAAVIDAASVALPRPTVRLGVSIDVTVSVAAKVTVRFKRGSKLLGSVRTSLPAGETTIPLKRLAKHAWKAGRDHATVSILGSSASSASFAFTVARG
jgi:hypothetical protein